MGEASFTHTFCEGKKTQVHLVYGWPSSKWISDFFSLVNPGGALFCATVSKKLFFRMGGRGGGRGRSGEQPRHARIAKKTKALSSFDRQQKQTNKKRPRGLFMA